MVDTLLERTVNDLTERIEILTSILIEDYADKNGLLLENKVSEMSVAARIRLANSILKIQKGIKEE